jgi:cell division protein FtsL
MTSAMATAPATARRATGTSRPQSERGPHSGRLLGPVPARSRRRAGRGRVLLVVAGALVLGSLLLVAASHAYIVQGQVGLAHLDQRLTSEEVTHRSLEQQVATLEDPNRIVSEAQHQGLVTPPQSVDLPQVPLTTSATAGSNLSAASTSGAASSSASSSGASR